MRLTAVGKTPDVWAAGVEQYGIIDWKTMVEHQDPRLQEYEKSLWGDPEKDREVYEADSPITSACHARGRIGNDRNVPYGFKSARSRLIANFTKPATSWISNLRMRLER